MIVAQVPSANYSPNTRSFGPAPVAVGVTKIQVTFTRENWPLTFADVIATIRIEGSTDGGATWPLFAETQLRGGVQIVSRTGLERTTNSLWLGFPEPETADRRVRATVINTATFRTAVTLETF